MQMSRHRGHRTELLAEVQAAIAGFDVGLAEVDQRHKVRITDSRHGLGNLRRRLPVLTGLGRKDILEGDAHLIAARELGELKQRFALTSIGVRPLEQLVRAKMATMLDDDSRADAIAHFHQRLGSIDLVADGGRVHEVGRHQAVNGIAEGKVCGQADRRVALP